METLTKDFVRKLIPLRAQNSNKSTYGKVLIITGSKKYSGAGYLAAKAASVCGCGYSYMAAPKSLECIYRSFDPEILFIPLEDKNGNLCLNSLKDIDLKGFGCVLIGPGIDTEIETLEFVKVFFNNHKNSELPFVIDADALNCLSNISDFVLPLNSVITPHEVELARFLDVTSECIQVDRFKFSQLASKKFNTNVILKGNKTLISLKNGDDYINSTGNSALAKSGSGDVLAGIIAGFCAQGQTIDKSSLLSVYLHGLCADIYAENFSEYSMTMKDLINYLPIGIKQILE